MSPPLALSPLSRHTTTTTTLSSRRVAVKISKLDSLRICSHPHEKKKETRELGIKSQEALDEIYTWAIRARRMLYTRSAAITARKAPKRTVHL